VVGLALSRPAHVPSAESATDLVAAADADADTAADRLHDGPVQALVVAHYAAEAATRGGDPIAARDAVQGALIELRRSLWHLRPRGADEGGLTRALEQLSGRLDEAGLPGLGFVVDETLTSALPAAVASTAYRLVQAVALVPHTDPVRVGLRREGSTAVLDVEGGALPEVDSWVRRASALGGSLTSGGTRTRLTVPLSAPRPKATS
jgi:signal transduction histidine kinase